MKKVLVLATLFLFVGASAFAQVRHKHHVRHRHRMHHPHHRHMPMHKPH